MGRTKTARKEESMPWRTKTFINGPRDLSPGEIGGIGLDLLIIEQLKARRNIRTTGVDNTIDYSARHVR